MALSKLHILANGIEWIQYSPAQEALRIKLDNGQIRQLEEFTEAKYRQIVANNVLGAIATFNHDTPGHVYSIVQDGDDPEWN